MAGMRLYGLQQRKRTSKSRAVSEVPSQTANLDPPLNSALEDVDEYKLVYHQTFKGCCFALREHFAKSTVNQAVMREVADKLLAIFCSDPLAAFVDNPGDGFGRDVKEEDSPFAPASGGVQTVPANDGFNTPKVRRRYRDGDSAAARTWREASPLLPPTRPGGEAIDVG